MPEKTLRCGCEEHKAASDASYYGWMGLPAASFYPAAASCSAQPLLPHLTIAACAQAQPQGLYCAAAQPQNA